MALVHEKLYQTKDLANIDFGDYVRDLVAGMLGSYGTLAARVSIHAEAASLLLDVDRAIPAGLVLNELVSNSFKHGFPNDRSGRIDVRLSGGDGLPIQLSVQDDGIGWPQGFDPTRSPSLGLKLVHILAKQLRSSLRFNGENGLHCTLTFDTVPC